MKGVILGATIFCLGLICLVCGIYYGWIVVTPGVNSALSERYSFVAALLTYLSYAMMFIGFVVMVLSVRRVNRRDRRRKK
jgi:hypothetical protein